jgi:hypothetical protein
MAKIFISYAPEDREAADHTKEQLAQWGADVFIDDQRLVPGNDFYDQLRDEIDASDKLVLLVSARSLQSKWVDIEVKYAHYKNKRIIPVMLEAVDLTPFFFLIHVENVDFRRWRTDRQVGDAIRRLVTALELTLPQTGALPQTGLPTKIEPPNLLAEHPVLAGFVKVRSVRVLRHITQGHSGSKVFLVKAVMRGEGSRPLTCFLKIHHAQGETPLMRHQRAYETLRQYMPKVLDATNWDFDTAQIALLYEVERSAEDFVSLDQLLKNRAWAAQRLIERTCQAISHWNAPIDFERHYRFSPPGELLAQAMSHSEDADVQYRRLHDPHASVFARLQNEFQISRQTPLLRFEGPGFDRRSLWPNPLIFLGDPEAWGSRISAPIPWLCGHIHGDMNTRNILALYDEAQSLLLIDFDTYDPQNLTFLDYCQLELGAILSLCDPAVPDNQRTLVNLSEYLANNLSFNSIPNLDAKSVGIVEILRPIRHCLSDYWQFDQELLPSYWLARIAVGLEMSRKMKARKGERVFALLFAADSLDQLLRYFHMDSPARNQASVVQWPPAPDCN